MKANLKLWLAGALTNRYIPMWLRLSLNRVSLALVTRRACHRYAIGHDFFGNAFVAYKSGNRVDYIYGMFKGKELFGGHLDSIESWHQEGEHVVFTDHPVHGNIVLVMEIPVKEITGEIADAAVAIQRALDRKPDVCSNECR